MLIPSLGLERLPSCSRSSNSQIQRIWIRVIRQKADAENAIGTMNGQWLEVELFVLTGQLVNHLLIVHRNDTNAKPLTFDEVYNQSSPTNCTVYCGGITQGLSGECLLIMLIYSLRCLKCIKKQL
ncbi:nucleolysin TIA-1 isoform p40 [Caerostris extrusa]|uniref:Nucleolysin TIA-1 isoform p40 n=1 Tax=Caerostris extrusa TaxID=172846 RepID=A0AAV4TRU2_CAEEX|nr:nucleolysin TIA-1 isoform p40 [Caerostris extrusa]